MPSASTTNQLADIATYMWSANLLQRAAFNGGSMGINEGRDIVLLVENAALSYGIEQSLDGVEGVALDVYRLVGQMLQPANEVLASGSGGVVPSPSGTGYYQPSFIDHTVTAGESGSMTIQNDDWIGLQGLVELSINQQVFQLNLGFLFSSVSGTLNFDVPASGNQYTLQENDQITAQGLYKIINS